MERWMEETLPGIRPKDGGFEKGPGEQKERKHPDFPPKSRILDWLIRGWLSGESSPAQEPLLADAVGKQ